MKKVLLLMLLVASIFAHGYGSYWLFGVPEEPSHYLALEGNYNQFKASAGRRYDNSEKEMFILSAGNITMGAGISYGLGGGNFKWCNVFLKPCGGIANLRKASSGTQVGWFYGGTAKYYAKIYKNWMFCVEAGALKDTSSKEVSWIYSAGLHWHFPRGQKSP